MTSAPASSSAPASPIAPASSGAAGGSSAASRPPATPQLLAITLQPADVPAGWKSTPYQPDPSDAADNAALDKCLGVPDTDSDETGEADSPDYSLANATISSSASSYKSQADITTDTETIKSPKISSCLDALFATQLKPTLPTGSTLGGVSITVTPHTSTEPANVIATAAGTISVTASGQSIVVYLNVAFITGPLIEAEVDFEDVGQPVPVAIQTAAITKVAARAANGGSTTT